MQEIQTLPKYSDFVVDATAQEQIYSAFKAVSHAVKVAKRKASPQMVAHAAKMAAKKARRSDPVSSAKELSEINAPLHANHRLESIAQLVFTKYGVVAPEHIFTEIVEQEDGTTEIHVETKTYPDDIAAWAEQELQKIEQSIATRAWLKQHAQQQKDIRQTRTNGTREVERRQRQIERGSLRSANGLVGAGV
jgi:hypothetical protein